MSKYVWTLRNDNGDTADIVRDVNYLHPAWIHKQLGTTSEEELQSFLDNCHQGNYFDKSTGDYMGCDCIGLGLREL